MPEHAGNGGERRGSRWRVAAWSTAALVLLVPLVAMQFTDEVDWSAFDFVFAGALILGVGVPYELAVRRTGDTRYRAGAGVALAAVFLMVWLSGAVGIIGSEDNGANLMYAGVLLVGVAGSILARFRSRGMAWTLAATAFAQAAVTVVAVVAELGLPESGPLEIVVLNGFFIAMWVGSALLFLEASRGETERNAA